MENPIIIENADDVERVRGRLGKRIGIVTQTTLSVESIIEVLKKLLLLGIKDIRIFDTRCRATELRQRSAIEIAKKVDVMLVIGGKHSANTRRLAQICSRLKPTYHIETKRDINLEWLANVKLIGVTAGASTPDWIIDDVVEYLEKLWKKEKGEEKNEIIFIVR